MPDTQHDSTGGELDRREEETRKDEREALLNEIRNHLAMMSTENLRRLSVMAIEMQLFNLEET